MPEDPTALTFKAGYFSGANINFKVPVLNTVCSSDVYVISAVFIIHYSKNQFCRATDEKKYHRSVMCSIKQSRQGYPRVNAARVCCWKNSHLIRTKAIGGSSNKVWLIGRHSYSDY